MTIKILLSIFISSIVLRVSSCNNKNTSETGNHLLPDSMLWTDVNYKSLKVIGEQGPLPVQFRAVRLNTSLMREKLNKIISPDGENKFEVIEFPLPEGGFSRYKIIETQTMDAALLEKFPQLRTYGGQGIDEPTSTARIDFMPSGFHGYFFVLKGALIIEPFSKGDTVNYLSYYKQDSSVPNEKFEFDADSVKHRE